MIGWDMGLGFGWDLGLRFGSLFWRLIMGKNTKNKNICLEKIMKGIKKKKDKKDIQLIYFVLMYLVIKKAQERYRKL